jgi:hypothetical protein
MFSDISGPDGNPDGIIDQFDRTVLANTIPTSTLGFNLSMNFKGFDLTALIQGAYGYSVMLANANYGGGRGFFDVPENLVIERYDRWNGEGTSNTQPRVYWGGSPNDNNRNSDFFVEEAAYTRLKNLQIGYTIPARLLERASIKRLRIYVFAIG